MYLYKGGGEDRQIERDWKNSEKSERMKKNYLSLREYNTTKKRNFPNVIL